MTRIRGILAERHGVPVDSMTHLTGGQEQQGRVEKQALDLPPGIKVERIEAGRTLAEMLASGELGADYWSYGLGPDRHTLETFLRYHHAQGLSKRLFSPEELFAPESCESAVI
ncbi:hypothetical protein [Kibdelosporangium aridum]|uniref:Uncharacterized protein n=1 Tax=Kibdelosporangium aridum TaxID=2030 RepID=A0A1W2FL82_KIBAR|nr:hypothetical protein [Kibdelosporangium aridum]SMD22462.1 hypothetical protein SAMN05661093_07424 [Kibdelosporangium aridum]